MHRRKTRPDAVIGAELCATLCRVSGEIGRQVGLLMDRRGRVVSVIVGTPGEIVIPDLRRIRAGAGRLRGLRLIHTHLNNEPLSRDDLTDLALLRLDLIAAVGVSGDNQPATWYAAHISPDQDADPVWTLLDPVPFHQADLAFADFIQELESELARHDARAPETDSARAILAHISNLSRREAGDRLAELAELARTEKIVPVDRVTYKGTAHPQSLLGAGRMKELIIRAKAQNVDLLLVDQELSPAQSRYIASLADLAAMDRTQLILRIFARRAFSKDGKLRVELARLKYTLPRLGSRDDSLSRIRGGIGLRGPGETALEVSGRRIRERIQHITVRLEKLSKGRAQRRRSRTRSGVAQVAVVGYTNAGKSTLLNALTNSDVLVEDKLFATLDPASRKIRFPKSIEVVFSDTVGFIRDLPEDLLDAFRSTLEELHDADLLLHLIDLSSRDFHRCLDTVDDVLLQLSLHKIPRLLVFNKIDLVDPETVSNEAARYNAISISAQKRIGLGRLTGEIEKRLAAIMAGKSRRPETAPGKTALRNH